TEPSRVHLPKTLGGGTHELGTQIGPGVGRTPGQRVHQPQRELRGHRGVGLFVGAAGVSSLDCFWQTLEYFSAPACDKVTGHDEPSRVLCESKDGKDS